MPKLTEAESLSWTVCTSWRASAGAPDETLQPCPDWPTARSVALRMTCCAGARYVSVLGPDALVVADYDRYTNRWREYPGTRRLAEGSVELPEPVWNIERAVSDSTEWKPRD